MEKQLIDDIKQILIESTYFIAYIQGTEKTPTAQEMLHWKRLAISMYMDNPRFMSMVDQQTVMIINKIKEHNKSLNLLKELEKKIEEMKSIKIGLIHHVNCELAAAKNELRESNG